MKATALLALICIAIETSAYLIKVPTSRDVTAKPNLLSDGWLHRQKLLLPLFDNVCEDSIDPVVQRVANEFVFSSSDVNFTKTDVVTNLINLKAGKGLLAKNEIFSEYDTDHFKELEVIFEFLYHAKDFDTFYKAAAWTRQNVNCGVFVDAIYLAIIKRRDTERILVPGPYELLPNYFIVKDTIVKASVLLSGEDVTATELDNVQEMGITFNLDSNYTSAEAYFMEDVGLNSFYFALKLDKTFWVKNTLDSNGEILYYKIKQLQTRYNLERYSNGLPEVESIKWDTPLEISYNPLLIYSTGENFSHRTMPLDVANTDVVKILKDIENNVTSIATHMMQLGYKKTQIINTIMETLVGKPDSYEYLAQKLLGKDISGNSERAPSVLEHYMTTLRDPMFWKINQKIVELVDTALAVLPSYLRSELLFPGVEVVSVDVKKMITSFDPYEFDVTQSLKSSTSNTTFFVKIRQPRLNHKMFTVKLNVTSLVTQRGLVKIYLGPKTLLSQMSAKDKFLLLDSFEVNLKMGVNIISRTSDEMGNLSEDFISLRTLHLRVEDAEFGLDALPSTVIGSFLKFPSRLILPKGSAGGLPFQMFVFIAPFVKASVGGMYSDWNTAILSPGYPLDLNVEVFKLFNLPNSFVKDVMITSKGSIVKSQSFRTLDDNNSYEYSRPNFADELDERSSYNLTNGQYNYIDQYSTRPARTSYQYNKEPFDYNAKRGQYGKKNDFTTRKDGGSFYEGRQIEEGDKAVEVNEDIAKVKLESSTNIPTEIDVVSKIDTNDTQYKSGTNDIDYNVVNHHSNEYDMYVRPILKSVGSMKRLPTFFDYLLPKTRDNDDKDDEVFE